MTSSLAKHDDVYNSHTQYARISYRKSLSLAIIFKQGKQKNDTNNLSITKKTEIFKNFVNKKE